MRQRSMKKRDLKKNRREDKREGRGRENLACLDGQDERLLFDLRLLVG